MKKSFCALAVALLGVVSCTKENSTSTSSQPEITVNERGNADGTVMDEIANGTYCYLETFNNDSIKVKVKVAGDKITGDLDRIPFQKDRAKGTFTGTKRADGKYDVDYKYMQEGMDQSAALVFDIEKDELEISNDPVYNAELKSVACK